MPASRLRSTRPNISEVQPAGPAWFVYLLRCADGSLYCGITTDPERRLREHNQGRGARYTRGRRPVLLIHLECLPSRAAATRREVELKRLQRAAKLAVVAGNVQ